MAATKKQLANLKKARAALKKKRAGKNPRARKVGAKRKPAKKRVTRKTRAKKRTTAPRKKTARKKRAKRNPTTSLEYFVWFQKGGKGTRYYVQKIGGKWVLDSAKPDGMGAKKKDDAMRVGKRLIRRVPAGYNLYMDVKKKRG